MMLQEDHESMGRQWYPHVNKIQQIWAALQSISAKLTCDETLGPTATLSLRAVLFGHPASSFTASPLRCGSGTEKKTGGARFPTAEENIAISCAAMTGKTWHECPSSARTTQLVAFVARMRGMWRRAFPVSYTQIMLKQPRFLGSFILRNPYVWKYDILIHLEPWDALSQNKSASLTAPSITPGSRMPRLLAVPAFEPRWHGVATE